MMRKAINVCGLLLGLTSLSGSAELSDRFELDSSTGYLYSADQPFHLYGVKVIDHGLQCIANERIWECGKAAHQALLNYVEKESLICVLLPVDYGPDTDPPAAECFLGPHSVNAQLVAEGWALTTADVSAPYRKEALAAQKNGEGIFRGGFVPPDEWRPKFRVQLEDCSVCTARHQSLIRAHEKRKAQLESKSENN
jgi:endonuclease YncB( thermonuclease family)